MNWKMIVISHWKVALLLLSLSLIAIKIICGTAFAEMIDCPGGG